MTMHIADQAEFPFVLPELPYAPTALEPHMTAATFVLHYGKHHQAYVTNLNKLVDGTDKAAMSLEELIHLSAGKADMVGIFNNAGQVWNHTFFWHCMKPAGGGKPTGALAAKIDADFGSFDAFADAFKTNGIGQFGSGWVWLVLDQGKLKVTKTSNADTPLAHGQVPLLTADVWEHAYYVDYQNRRPDYLATFLTHLVNWDFVASNLANA
jgi:Fe-Mn family superoxide dismutase